MIKKRQTKIKKMLLLAVAFLLLSENVFAKPKQKTDLVKEEDGYYYGYGKASTKEEAVFAAKKDLVENALTSTLRATNPEAAKISVKDEVVDVRLGDAKAFNESKNGLSVVFRIKASEWEKTEKGYSEKIRKSLAEALNIVSSKGDTALRLEKASLIFSTLTDNGIYDLLTLQEKSTELYSLKVENICKSIISDIAITVDSKDTIISPNSKIKVTVKDTTGKPISNLSLKASWAVPYLPISLGKEELPEVISVLTTDSNGNATVDYPMAEEYQNTALELTISTAFSLIDNATKGMRQLDGETALDCRYFCVNDIAQEFKVVDIKKGNYVTGKLESDLRAIEKEASRTVSLSAYSMAIAPVTNAQFAIYLYLTRNDETPEYFHNEDYNQPDFPVIGVTFDNAQGFCQWLSNQTGARYRLPSDDEWEVAARAGRDVIYTWGNDDPSKGKKANYKGNGKFKSPSPVGSFDIGNNPWGITDMCGNVWEWTITIRNSTDTQIRTVKGGSWMDGPVDLRISNFKNIDITKGYPDVGFRFVKEASK